MRKYPGLAIATPAGFRPARDSRSRQCGAESSARTESPPHIIHSGVRMALGAQRSSILGMILRQGMALAAAGLGVGMAAAMASTRLISGLLFGVTPTDPVTFAAVAVILFGVAGCATLLPAVRATQVDPLTALRDE